MRVLLVDVNRSLAQAVVEQRKDHRGAGPSDRWGPLGPHPTTPSPLDTHDDFAMRLGLAPIGELGRRVARATATGRCAYGPYRDLVDPTRRVSLSCSRLESLTVSGAPDNLGVERRQVSRAAGVLSDEHGRRRGAFHQRPEVWRQPMFPGTAVGSQAPTLLTMTGRERQVADLSLTGVSMQGLPLRLL